MRKFLSIALPILGLFLIMAYIKDATVNVVYTDYIRQVGTYMEEFPSFKEYLHVDCFLRTPICWLERLINVRYFDYSTTFDMLLGAVGLSLSALVVSIYSDKYRIPSVTLAIIMFIMFSLNKWEMLTNGTGWNIFFTFALLYYHFFVYDRVRNGKKRTGDEFRLCALPAFTMLLFAGQYTAIYFAAVFLVYLIDVIGKLYDTRNSQKADWAWRFVMLIIPFILFTASYMLSEPAEIEGATDGSIVAAFTGDPILFGKMILKSLASTVIGGETIMEYSIPEIAVYIAGIAVAVAYVAAIMLNFSTGLYKRTAFPLLMIIAGIVSHGVVLISRWIFMNPDYMMSSRYALQFQSGIIGIILTFAMCRSQGILRKKYSFIQKIIILLLLAGNILTTYREVNMIKYRREAFENMRHVAINYENETDETLHDVLQYKDPVLTRKALDILKERKLNVFKWNEITDL